MPPRQYKRCRQQSVTVFPRPIGHPPRPNSKPVMSSLYAPRLNPSLLVEKKEQLDKYVCPKCDSILWEAVQTSCGHWLCNGCAEELFDKKYVPIILQFEIELDNREETPICPRPDCNEELTTKDRRPVCQLVSLASFLTRLRVLVT